MLEFKDATIKVGERVLAEHLSLIAKDGELTCVTGPEGSGKTVLLRTLMGFLPVSEGFVSVDGELLTVHSAGAFRKMMAYLPQQIQLLRHQLEPPEAPVSKADDYAVWGGGISLKPVVETLSAPLSPDEILRLAAETLRQSADKQIIIADEPAARLSAEQTLQMLDLFRQQAAAGKTVLIASRKPQIVAEAQQVISL